MLNYSIFKTEVYILIVSLLKLKSEFNKLIFTREEILISSTNPSIPRNIFLQLLHSSH